MSVRERRDGAFLIRVYLGRDPVTKKRVEVNETLHGTISEARKRETELKARHYAGRLTKSSQMTLDALFEEYLKSARHRLAQATYVNSQKMYRLHVSPFLGNFPLDRIKPSHVQQMLNILLDEKEASDAQTV